MGGDMTQMNALRFYGIHDVRLETLPVPEPGEGDVRIAVLYAGICGSDLHIFNKAMFVEQIPQTMGHEFIGRIEKLGPGVSDFEIGDLVMANPMVPCMACESCKKGSYNTCACLGFIGEVSPGCFAEYLTIEANKLIRVPPWADIRLAALTEPLAVALNIARRANPAPGDKIAVIGAGPIGLLAVCVFKNLYGVLDITVSDLSENRLKLAASAGAKRTVTDLDRLGETFDINIEAAGVQATVNSALRTLKAGGTLCVVSVFEQAVALDMNVIVGKQLRVLGCNVYEGTDLRDAACAIAESKLDLDFIITHEFPLQRGAEAFSLLNSKDKTAAKILFKLK